MANLFNQNIRGTDNYKGLLNIGASIGEILTTTLKAVTDGAGNNSTLELSTTLAKISSNLIIGSLTSASARLQVRGDGTNPIAIFEKSNQSSLLQITEDSLVLGSNNIKIATAELNNPLTIKPAANSPYFLVTAGFNKDWPSPQHIFTGSNQIFNTATQTNNPAGLMMINGIIGISNAAADTFDYLMLRLEYTINNTATSTTTANGIYLNATETNLNGQTHNLLNLQVNGNTKAKISNIGAAIFGGTTNDASAILQADSTTQGFLLPRMTTTQRDNINAPALGLLIYNTTTDRLNIYNGNWIAVH